MLLTTALNECSDVPQWNLTHGGRPLLRSASKPAQRGVDVHQLEQLVGVARDGGARAGRVEHEAEAERAALAAGVAHRRRRLAGDLVGLPAVALAERERRRVEHALDAGAGLDLEVRLLQLGHRGHGNSLSPMRASERQRVSGHRLRRLRVAWPGNAVIVMGSEASSEAAAAAFELGDDAVLEELEESVELAGDVDRRGAAGRPLRRRAARERSGGGRLAA